MRVELRDGQWAELRERISHGTDKHLKRSWRSSQDDPDRFGEIETELIRAFVTSWHVLDIDGAAVPLGNADDLPEDIADLLSTTAAELYRGATDPNAPTPD